jgi:hypothetical protein
MAADELNKQGFNVITMKEAILHGKNKKRKMIKTAIINNSNE